MTILQFSKAKGLDNWIKNHSTHLICGVIVLLSFIVMMRYGGLRSPWYDDLITLAFARSDRSLSEVLYRMTIGFERVPPLYFVVAVLWYRIAPFGTLWLFFPSIIFTAIGMFACGMVAKRLLGNYAAVFTTIIASASSFQIILGAFTFRHYGLLFMLSALYAYFYLRRLEEQENIKCQIAFGVTGAALAYTHHFGLFIIAALGLCDVVLLLCKKVKFRYMLAYAVSGALYIPYFIPMFLLTMEHGYFFHVPQPTIHHLHELLLRMSGDSPMVYLFTLFGVVFIVVLAVNKYARSYLDMDFLKLFAAGAIAFSFMVSIAFIYIYSRFLTVNSSLWEHRYFTAFLPNFLITSGIGLSFIFQVLFKEKTKQHLRLLAVVGAFTMALWLGSETIRTVNRHANTIFQPYAEVGNWISNHEFGRNADTLIISRVGRFMDGSAFSYFTTQGGNISSDARHFGNWHARWVNNALEGYFLDFINAVYIYEFPSLITFQISDLYVLHEYFDLVYRHNEWNSNIYVFRRRELQ